MPGQLPKYEDGWAARRARPPTPLVLKRLLIIHRLSYTQLGDAMKLENGKHPAPSTVSQIVNRNIWPKHSVKQLLEKQIESFLREQDVPESEIDTALEIDSNPGIPRSAKRGNARVATPFIDADQLPEAEMLSQQAKKHFKLFQDPFLDDVQGPKDVFLDEAQRYIREVMYQAAIRSGFLAVIGESGAGKTTLRKDLINRIDSEQAPIVLIQPRIIDKGRLSAGAICDAIIQDVSMEVPKHTLEGKARQIETLLGGSARAGNSHVLVIEEAHDLNVTTLKYLKRFWELEDGFRSLLGIILIGQPELKNLLDERINWDAREVIRRCEIAELKPLDNSLEGYLELKFKRLGKNLTEIFDEDAATALRERLILKRHGSSKVVSMLYPLVVNNTVRKAMNLAAEIGSPKVSADIVRGI
ncbi:MAG: AAA family ATPase [Candidatus Thiodiazotropha endolucinida]